jgi:hypothetical protein
MAQSINIPLKFTPEMNAKALNVIIATLKKSLGKDLTKDMQYINIAKLEEQFRKTGASVSQLGEKVKQTTPQVEKMTTTFGGFVQQAFVINQVAQSLSLVTSALGPYIDNFVELDKHVHNLGTLGVKNYQDFMKASSDLAKEVPGDASVVAQAVYQLASAGTIKTDSQGMLDVGESMNFVATAAKDAVSGLSDVKTATDLYTSQLNAYGKSAKDVGEISNATFAAIKYGKTTFEELAAAGAQWTALAASTGVGFDEVNNALARMTAQGTPTSQAATQIRAAMVLIQKGGPGLNQALKEARQIIRGIPADAEKTC